MKKLLVLLSLSTALCAADVKGSPQDEQAIRKAIADGTATFNRHEPMSADTVAADFDVVVPPGSYHKAGPDGEARMRKDFDTIFKNARESATVDRIRFIRPDVALVDGTFEISGSDIKPDPKGLQTMVLVKENGRWLVTARRRMIPVARPIGR